MKKGVFITLEGPDGAGKSTHAKRLAAWIRRQGRHVLLTREPGGTAVGMKLRRILLDSKPGSIDPLVELFLYEASRAVLVREVIRPALRKGQVVLLDRFQDSTWVYQGWAGRMNLELVKTLGTAATGGLQPDRTILLDLPARQGLARVRKPNRMEAKPVAFHEQVRTGYRVLARRGGRRIRIVKVNGPIAQVQAEIRREVSDLF
ncbi:MAG: dTMP kinase [Candidatus Omnitrophica bacterium]|nr:dTMP kinase [Candidatus Omnitrophota bacterium]